MANTPIALRSREIDDDELRQMLQAAIANGDNHDVFFQQFDYHFDENPFLTLTRGEVLLRKCKEVAPNEYTKLHKGTPFYWLARAAFKVHDYETAAFYIDAAVSDDLRAADDRGDDRFSVSTPAILFFVANDGNPNQASIALVKDLSATIKNAINEHNLRPEATPVNLNDIQQHFFYPALVKGNEHLRTQVTTFLTFMLEWDHRSRLIQLRTERGTAEPFFLHLFKGCVLFESLLKSKAPSKAGKKLGPVLNALRPSLGLKHPPKISGFTFEQIVNGLALDGDSVSVAIERTGRIRNTTAHSLNWAVSLASNQYDRLAGYISSACLHTLACLYK